ncbi:MAG: PAS domain-containing protein [Acidobacteria bacterium]|nr:PAS domain-containing protein [Acidobacteriota bacterium]
MHNPQVHSGFEDTDAAQETKAIVGSPKKMSRSTAAADPGAAENKADGKAGSAEALPEGDTPGAGDREDEDARIPAAFPIVGIGASAGGLEAFKGLLQHLPVDAGMAFVFVQHLAAGHASMLPSLLSRTTKMPVLEVRHGMPVEPDRVYIIPANTLMSVASGVLKLEPRPEEHGAPRPIDYFLRSLAADRKADAIGVIMSGADSDGALGLQAIRDEGGIAIVQSESSARHPEMPRAALAAGVVDLVLSPEEIGDALGRFGRKPSPTGEELSGDPANERGEEDPLNRILALVRGASGVDFRGYKRGTVQRRIHRRMILQGHEDLETYGSVLESHRSELQMLFEDMLIPVTGFFRDPETFQALQDRLLPRLWREREAGKPLRLWVPGCSTGEEAYSIAMCLIETMQASSVSPPVQIFATDLSEHGISAARAAIYPERQVARLSPERKARFFRRVENGYQVIKPIREMCVFARHNLLADPPYSRLDLISCRNVLIYLRADLQSRVMATFHFALRPGGYLLLGHSEGVQRFEELFAAMDAQHKVYVRKPGGEHGGMEIVRGSAAGEPPGNLTPAPSCRRQRTEQGELEKAAERLVLSEYGPAWVIVNDRFEILHVQGDTSSFLRLAPGRATHDLMKMTRECIRGELRKLMARARSEKHRIQSAVFQASDGGEIRSIRLEVRRIAGSEGQDGRWLVLFFAPGSDKEMEPGGFRSGQARPDSGADAIEVERLRQELLLTSQHMQSLIDERDAANQDITSANEEIQSSNEELQSINEELETSKEELQASNEELNTLNEELHNRNRELSRLSDDLSNLLSSTTIPILMLDNELHLRRVTAAAEKSFHIRAGDIGLPFESIRRRLKVDGLEPMMRRVMETLSAEELEVQDLDQRWYQLAIRPYRTAGNRIEGVVLTLIDIDQIRQAQIRADAARDFAESVVESVQTPLVVLRGDLRIRKANRAFCESYGLEAAEIENRFFHEIDGGRWNLSGLQSALRRLPAKQERLEKYELELAFPGLGRRQLLVSAQSVQPEGENQILVAMADITSQKRAELVLIDEQERLKRNLEFEKAALHETEAALLRSRNDLRALTAKLLYAQAEERRRVSRELHDDLSQQLAKLQFDVETMEQHLPSDSGEMREKLLNMRDGVESLSNDIRRIAYELHPSALDHLGLSVALRSHIREFMEREGITVRFTTRKVPAKIPAEVANTLYRIAQEALRNVAKHAGKTAVRMALTGGGNQLSLVIRDDGIGFDVHSAQDKEGLGLISMQERARLVQGDFSLETLPGRGATITVRVPLDLQEA